MNDTRSHIIVTLVAFTPYLLVAWGYMAVVDGGSPQFWRAFGGLIAARLFFNIIETLGSVLSWQLYGKKRMVNKFLGVLRANDFPKRKHAHNDFLDYLVQIESGPEYGASLKASAKEIYFLLPTFEDMGILLRMRMHSASDAALDLHSPKSEVTKRK